MSGVSETSPTPIRVFDGETVIERAQINVNMIGGGAIVTLAMYDDEDTIVIAESRLIPDFDLDSDVLSESVTALTKSTRATLDASVVPS